MEISFRVSFDLAARALRFRIGGDTSRSMACCLDVQHAIHRSALRRGSSWWESTEGEVLASIWSGFEHSTQNSGNGFFFMIGEFFQLLELSFFPALPEFSAPCGYASSDAVRPVFPAASSELL